MKKTLLTILTLAAFFSFAAQAQDDASQLVVGVKMPVNTTLPAEAQNALQQKAMQLTTLNGYGSATGFSQFVIRPVVEVTASELAPTAPPQQLVKLSVTFYLVDNYEEQTVFSQASVNVKGVGKSTAEAYVNAIQQLNVRSSQLKKMMEDGKKKIITYYNTQCDRVVEKAYAKAQTGLCEEALSMLSNVPQVCGDCVSKSAAAAAEIKSSLCSTGTATTGTATESDPMATPAMVDPAMPLSTGDTAVQQDSAMMR